MAKETKTANAGRTSSANGFNGLNGSQKSAILQKAILKEPIFEKNYCMLTFNEVNTDSGSFIACSGKFCGSTESIDFNLSKEQYDAFGFSKFNNNELANTPLLAKIAYVDASFGYVNKEGNAEAYRSKGYYIQQIESIGIEDSREYDNLCKENAIFARVAKAYRQVMGKAYDAITATNDEKLMLMQMQANFAK